MFKNYLTIVKNRKKEMKQTILENKVKKNHWIIHSRINATQIILLKAITFVL